MANAAAFFDLDRTLVAGSSGIHFMRAARAAGLVSRRRFALDLLLNLRYRLRGASDAQADAVRERIAGMLEGQSVRALGRLSPRVLAGVLPRLCPTVLARAHEHQDDGLRVYICTAASQEMAELMAHILGFDGALGSRSEIEDGRYTGRPAGPFAYGAGKAELVAALAERERIVLGDSYAYSDSASDEPLLRIVGHPVAVNPDRALARVAASEGWPVMRADRLARRIRAGGALGAIALLSALARSFARVSSRRAPRAG